ncbi:hypothetical protein MNBD_GAMMA18-976 [hydrothermal vent metagenome]|uniref:VOC domain-containing protein n=1 Tax=hydrothermal vent metagenome TaxID=652676 RepID=A0A3B0ZQB6_9ZZZZ
MTTPAQKQKPMTQGIHHLGLNVSRLEASAVFFVELLGWREVCRDPDYPAIFVSDGMIMLTLWGAAEGACSFDYRRNVGLHHVAFTVASHEALEAVYARIRGAEGVFIEFAPELLRDGPAMHMMCFEPSGIRVEFIWPG